MKCKQAFMHGPFDLRIEEVELPALKDDQVLIKLLACGICQSDVECFEGKSAEGRYDLGPYTPGHEWVGRVTEIGKNVTSIKVGDKVVGDCVLPCHQCANCKDGKMSSACLNMREVGFRPDSPGGFGEYMILEEAYTHVIPEDWSDEIGIFGAGFNLLDNLTGGKLSSLRAVYEEHGGGIQGAAAATVEGVKGVFGAGFNFLDSLTGGKLTSIKDKFTVAMGGFPRSAREKLLEAQAAFSNGLNGIKNTVTGAVTWFFDSGKKIVSTFANGIRSAFSGAVDAVRGGLQKIRNLLPFSDAKEGPLSTLTLSGQRTMTTYAHGLVLAQNAPAAAMEQGLQRANAALEHEPVKKVDFGNSGSREDNSDERSESGNGNRQVIIQKLIMQAGPLRQSGRGVPRAS